MYNCIDAIALSTYSGGGAQPCDLNGTNIKARSIAISTASLSRRPRWCLMTRLLSLSATRQAEKKNDG